MGVRRRRERWSFFFLLVLGISCHDAVVSEDVKTIKSYAVTRLESRPNGDLHPKWRRDITKQQQDIYNITDMHNRLRRLEGASNMEVMSWNPRLAYLAQCWANQCSFKHGQIAYDKSSFRYTSIGQSIYATTGKFTFKGAIESFWYGEKQYYNYDSGSCKTKKSCGHYTQLIWARSYEIGCGYAKCRPLESWHFSNNNYSWFLVCNYGPAGNKPGEKPFEKGNPCSNCSGEAAWCTERLCNRGCKRASPNCVCQVLCQHGGVKNASSCICCCKDGWYGSDCSVECKDTDSRCNGKPGWPPKWCDHPAYGAAVRKACPEMCGLCKSAGTTQDSKIRSRAVANGIDYTTSGSISQHQVQMRSWSILLFIVAIAIVNRP